MWSNASQEFVSKNKYRGRALKTPDFPRVLRFFLCDGDDVLLEQIPSLIQKMYNLAAILSTLNGFRFYGCSLLLIYDGDKDVQDGYARHKRYEHHRPQHERGDSATMFSSATTPRRRPSLTSTSRRSRSADVTDCATESARRTRGEIVVRIVDFAHTTTGQDIVFPYPKGVVDPPNMGKGYETLFDDESGRALARFPPHHPNEADMGFIFGLSSIVASLRGIYHIEMERRRGAGQPVPPLPTFEHSGIFEKLFPEGFDQGYLST